MKSPATSPTATPALATCFVALGANLGDRIRALRAAVRLLNNHNAIAVGFDGGIAPLYETAPVGCRNDQPPYLNSVVRVETTLWPHDLLAVAMNVEKQLGRKRSARCAARAIDIDLLLYGEVETEARQSQKSHDFESPRGLKPAARGVGEKVQGRCAPLEQRRGVTPASCRWIVLEDNLLTLPHPRLHERRFVLEPLAHIAAKVVHPVLQQTIGDLAAASHDQYTDQSIQRVAECEWARTEDTPRDPCPEKGPSSRER